MLILMVQYPWVFRRLSEQDRVLVGSYSELMIKGVAPYAIHIVPVRDDAVLYRIL
jgi:hypothetical protein